MEAKRIRRDRAIGFTLIIVCLTVLPVYLLLVLFPAPFLHFFGVPVDSSTGIQVRVYATLIPVIIALTAALLAGAWIGLSIITTPAPREKEEEKKQ